MNKKNEEDNFNSWVIYNSPIEYPGEFVARRWVTTPPPVKIYPTDDIFRAKSLKIIRKEMERRYLYRLDRNPSDDPSIVECWI